MVHFLRREDANDSSTVAARDGLSRAPYDYLPFSSLGLENQQQVVMDYMAGLKTGMYNKILSANACTGMDMTAVHTQCADVDIAAMPGDIMTHFNDTCNDNNSTFGEYSLSATFEASLDGTNSTSGAVRFGNIHVREFNRTVGDHPDCSEDGPPLSMDWAYIQLQPIPLSKYEAKKKRRRRRRLERRHQRLKLDDPDAPFPKVPNIEFTVPRIRGPLRRELLHLEFDVPFQDLVAAEQEVKRMAAQREESNTQSILAEKTQELVESAQRKLRRSFFFGYGRHTEISRNGRTNSSRQVSPSTQATTPIYDRRHPRRYKASTSEMVSNYYGGRRVPQAVY